MDEPIDKLAKIARLDLTKEERERFAKELDSILKAFDIIAKAPTKGVQPATHPVPLLPMERKDVVAEGLSREDALRNTELKGDGFIKGPPTK
ncbi:MAG: Asp-tRNA(Asn)/Glu-tRNA(Gln) amidotransferase subunit GatC [Candidatus Woesearchaeota archaeon]